MKILVTGANGFIGSYFSNYLLKNGHEVVAVSRKFLPDVKDRLVDCKLIEIDILSDEFLNLNISCDAIVHLAAANDIVSKERLKGIELSTIGTVNVLQFAQRNEIKKVVFYSTLQVYGTELKGNYNEDTILKPENDYALNHIFSEYYCEMYSRISNLSVLVIRPSNIYGEFLSIDINRWSLVPGSFIKEFKKARTITLLSSGRQFRNFISLEQLSYSTIMAIDNMNRPYDILNLVGSEYLTIGDLAKLTSEVIMSIYGIEIEPIIKSENPMESNIFVFSQKKLEQYNIDINFSINRFNLKSEIHNLICKLDNMI
jgi:UDP-glucose 4-epimerase